MLVIIGVIDRGKILASHIGSNQQAWLPITNTGPFAEDVPDALAELP